MATVLIRIIADSRLAGRDSNVEEQSRSFEMEIKRHVTLLCCREPQ